MPLENAFHRGSLLSLVSERREWEKLAIGFDVLVAMGIVGPR